MSSVREQIVAASVVDLNAGSPPCVFERSRVAALTDVDLPRGVVYPARDTADSKFLGRRPVVRSRLSLFIELRALGTASVRPDQAVDPLYVWTVAKLTGNTHGGLLFDGWQEVESTLQYGAGDRPICLLTLEMVAHYQRLTADAEAVE